MVNYQNGKIYKIVGNNLTYYGSTCEPTLAKRLTKHKCALNEYKKGQRRFITSFKIIESGEYNIVLVEKHSCKSKDELHKRERFYIENNECVNKVIPGRTHKEYTQQQFKCVCGSHYYISHKIRHRNTKKHKHYMMLVAFNKFSLCISNIMIMINRTYSTRSLR